MKNLIQALRVVLVMTVLTGVLYPLLMLVSAQVFFPKQANGSLIQSNNQLIGSELIGQTFESPVYFWARPSAVSYNPQPSGGTNSGATSKALRDVVAERRQKNAEANAGKQAPDDLLLASASGLDPHISPEAAQYQIDRVVSARQLDSDQARLLSQLVNESIEPYSLGFIGEPRVNVLKLNLAVDSLFGKR